jgi:succinyl-CoA synthetase beta subunit
MKLLEYEAKQLLAGYDLPVPAGQVVRHGEAEALTVALPVMVKAQIPAGGRGKAGGVRPAETAADYAAARDGLLGSELLGHPVGAVLAEEILEPARELYLAVALDRAEQGVVLLAHHSGGVEINGAVKARGPALKIKLSGAPTAAMVRRVQEYLALPAGARGQLAQIVGGLWRAYTNEDAVLVEVNPLMVLPDGRMVCADAKIELDDAAAFRHRERAYELPAASSQFVVLAREGTIASLANGAGLAMATNDAIKAAGHEPANFFDVGGGTNAQDMTRGFDRIRELPGVQAIVVNIFGGITRCDEVAEAILAAQAAGPTPPLYIRLAGTNAAEGARRLAEAGVEILPSLAACVERAARQVTHV